MMSRFRISPIFRDGRPTSIGGTAGEVMLQVLGMATRILPRR
jgi:hypothetical protein